MAAAVPVCRGVGEHLVANGRRVILKRFFPSKVAIAERIVTLVAAQSTEESRQVLDETLSRFDDRHANLVAKFNKRFSEVNSTLRGDSDTSAESLSKLSGLSDVQRCVVGSLFLHEYAVEAAALFNPSVVPHPIPTVAGHTGDGMRVVVTLRSCGEGHISSISFREGVVTPNGRVLLEPNHCRRLETGDVRRCRGRDWDESAPEDDTPAATFRNPVTGHEFALSDGMYAVKFDAATPLSARVLFPQTPEQSNGIEDARFVRFVDDDGTATYYGTITAYDGKQITPQMIETPDFQTFTMHILTGDIKNKGMALFPRKVGGKYWMLSRQDDVNILVMSSSDVLHWDSPQVIVRPEESWEWFKMGNCGSPMETKYGWLVLTHGVGPLRRYAIGAVMLDLNDPAKVIGRLRQPLVHPNENEREGYVPNVVYTCGALVNDASGDVILPYAVSDSSSTFGSVKVDDIAAAMGLSAAGSKL